MMPEGGSVARSEQVAALSVVSHEILAAQETGDLPDAAEAQHESQPLTPGNMPTSPRCVACSPTQPRLTAICSKRCRSPRALAKAPWRQARPVADFAPSQAEAGRCSRLVRHCGCREVRDKLGTSPYEALMDEYEPGRVPLT